MGRGYSNKAKIGIHNTSFSIHPDKNIIESMGWKKGDSIEVIPLPDKGIICLKGKATPREKFLDKFYYKLLKKISLKDVKRQTKKLDSLIQNKFRQDPLDIIAYQEQFNKICKLRDQLKKIGENWEEYLVASEEALRKKFNLPLR